MNNDTFNTEVLIHAPIARVWRYFTDVKHIGEWASGSPDWETTAIKNELQEGGEFLSRMAAKDGSQSFEFGGIYDEVVPLKSISYTMGDGRKAATAFEELGDAVRVAQVVDAEHENPIEMQKAGWQSMLDNLKGVVEDA